MFPRLILSALATFAVACGGSGSSSGEGPGTESTFCVTGSGTSQRCQGSKNINSAAKSSDDEACGEEQGQVVSECPTTTLVDCCSFTIGGITTESCRYDGTSASPCAPN